jgi:hypothetical protein
MTATPRRRPAQSAELRLTLHARFLRSAPWRRVRPVASADVDGFTGPVTGTVAQQRPRTRRPPVGAVLLTALMVVFCACSSPAPPTQETTMDPQAELAARPTLEEMTARYDEQMQRIRDRLDTDLGPFTWYRSDGRTWGTCSKRFPSHLGGYTTTSPMWVSDRNIPDDQWPHAKRIVADITAEYGFATMGPADRQARRPHDQRLRHHTRRPLPVHDPGRHRPPGEERLSPLPQPHPMGALHHHRRDSLTRCRAQPIGAPPAARPATPTEAQVRAARPKSMQREGSK